MLNSDLKSLISALGVTQAEFARLIGVTPRAVTLWVVGDRTIPGPVEAYARLLFSAPASLRQVELARLKERGSPMRDGMYGVVYQSGGDAGMGVIILDNGRLYGGDPVGGKYDGDYVFDENTGMAELRLKLTFPPNVRAVFGISNPYEWSVDAIAKIDPHKDQGVTRIMTAIGRQIDAQYRYIRSLPEN